MFTFKGVKNLFEDFQNKSRMIYKSGNDFLFLTAPGHVNIILENSQQTFIFEEKDNEKVDYSGIFIFLKDTNGKVHGIVPFAPAFTASVEVSNPRYTKA
jgi:MFS superfamily sulfate permease-like transporter